MSERFKECVLKAQASEEAMGSNPIVPVCSVTTYKVYKVMYNV